MHKFDKKSSENKGLQPISGLPGQIPCALSAEIAPAPRAGPTQSKIDWLIVCWSPAVV